MVCLELSVHDHDGYHLAQAHAILEIIDPETEEVLEEGDIGEIVVTSTLRYDTPILRFRTGDLGYMDKTPCSCGVTLPKFYLRGRVQDQILIKTRHFHLII